MMLKIVFSRLRQDHKDSFSSFCDEISVEFLRFWTLEYYFSRETVIGRSIFGSNRADRGKTPSLTSSNSAEMAGDSTDVKGISF